MKSKPIVFDLFCGLGGWSEAFIAEGWRAVGFDIEAHDYGNGGYPGELVLLDIRSMSGAELVREYGIPAVIVASPPCQEFSYMAMPWSKAKEKQRKIEADPAEQVRLTDLFNQCFRIQREVSEAAGSYVPMVVENVRGAQRWVGKAKWNFGSFYLWGDLPALMPIPAQLRQKQNPDGTDHAPGSWFAIADSKNRGANSGTKLPGNNSPRRWDEREVKRLCDAGVKQRDPDGYDYENRNFGWKAPRTTSKSPKRKQASAEIAKIPAPLAQWIAKTFKPKTELLTQ